MPATTGAPFGAAGFGAGQQTAAGFGAMGGGGFGQQPGGFGAGFGQKFGPQTTAAPTLGGFGAASAAQPNAFGGGMGKHGISRATGTSLFFGAPVRGHVTVRSV